jgi:hypothetical protein
MIKYFKLEIEIPKSVLITFSKIAVQPRAAPTSSREINSLLKVRPGMSPRFFSQKMEAKLPEKKIPSTAAKAMTRSAKEELSSLIQDKAQSAFCFTHGIVSMALNRKSLEKYTFTRFG